MDCEPVSNPLAREHPALSLPPRVADEPRERAQRLTSVGVTSHVFEVFYDIKSLCFVGIALCVNAGTAVTSAFGPTLINNFSFDKYVGVRRSGNLDLVGVRLTCKVSALLNIPFGVLQFIVIIFSSWAAQKMSSKWIPLALLQIPPIVGCALLYYEGTSGHFRQSVALGGYYLLAFDFGCNPLLVSWMVANTAGQTKKSAIMSLYQAGSAAGNIIGTYPRLGTSHAPKSSANSP
jgi:hypothetical protein